MWLLPYYCHTFGVVAWVVGVHEAYGNQQVRELLHVQNANPKCMMLPLAVVKLLFLERESWSHIVALGRFFIAKRRPHGSRPTCSPLFADYPPQDWLNNVVAMVKQDRPPEIPHQLHPKVLHGIADHIRSWAPVLLRHCDELADDRLQETLREDVQCLTACARALEGSSDVLRNFSHTTVRHSAQRLLAAFQAMRHLRFRMGNFGTVLKSCVEAQWPDLFPKDLLRPHVQPILSLSLAAGH